MFVCIHADFQLEVKQWKIEFPKLVNFSLINDLNLMINVNRINEKTLGFNGKLDYCDVLTSKLTILKVQIRPNNN